MMSMAAFLTQLMGQQDTYVYIRDFRMLGSRCVREAKLELGSVQGRSRQTHDEENLTEVYVEAAERRSPGYIYT